MSCICQKLSSLLAPDSAITSAAAGMKEQRARSFTAGRALLKAALCREGLVSASEAMPPIATGAGGKPELCWPDNLSRACFNISHTDGVLALALGPESQGVDIEQISERRLRPALLKRVLNGREHELLEAMESSWQRAAFFARQWTLREALLKVTGRSIFAMDCLDIDPDAMTVNAPDTPSGWLLFKNLHLLVRRCSTDIMTSSSEGSDCALCSDTVRNEGIKTQLCCSYESQGRFMGYHFGNDIKTDSPVGRVNDDKGQLTASYALCIFHKADICPKNLTVMVHNDSFSVPDGHAVCSNCHQTCADENPMHAFTVLKLVPDAVIAVNQSR